MPGFPLPEGWVRSDTANIGDVWSGGNSFAPPPLPVDDLRDEARIRINTWRDEQERTRITFEHAGRTWDGGLDVRTRLAGLQSLPALPVGFFWTDAQDSDVPMTLAALGDLHAAHEGAIANRGFEIHLRQRAMKADIETMDAEQLQAFTPDWPADDAEPAA